MVKIDIPMPHNCVECPLRYPFHNIEYPQEDEWQYRCVLIKSEEWRECYSKRPKNCPLMKCEKG